VSSEVWLIRLVCGVASLAPSAAPSRRWKPR